MQSGLTSCLFSVVLYGCADRWPEDQVWPPKERGGYEEDILEDILDDDEAIREARKTGGNLGHLAF